MINALENTKRVKPLHFAAKTAGCAGLIFGIINFVHTQPYSVIKHVEEWETSQIETNEEGLYINNWFVPLKDLIPGKITEPLPYSLIRSEEETLHFYVNHDDYDVSVFSRDGQQEDKWDLETTLSPSDFQGKEGLTLNGYLADEYLVKIVHHTKRLPPSPKQENNIAIQQTPHTQQYLLWIVMNQ